MSIQLTKQINDIDVSNDSIVILLNTFTLPGGRVLDVTGFAPDAVQAGHIILRDATGKYKPLGVTGSNFNAVTDEIIAGIVVASVDKVTQGGGVAIMVQGAVNTKAMPYAMDATLEGKVRTALNQIYFTNDNY